MKDFCLESLGQTPGGGETHDNTGARDTRQKLGSFGEGPLASEGGAGTEGGRRQAECRTAGRSSPLRFLCKPSPTIRFKSTFVVSYRLGVYLLCFSPFTCSFTLCRLKIWKRRDRMKRWDTNQAHLRLQNIQTSAVFHPLFFRFCKFLESYQEYMFPDVF